MEPAQMTGWRLSAAGRRPMTPARAHAILGLWRRRSSHHRRSWPATPPSLRERAMPYPMVSGGTLNHGGSAEYREECHLSD